MGRVTIGLWVRELSTMMWRNIIARVERTMRGKRKNPKGKGWWDRMSAEERGRVEEGKLQGESPHDMQDQAEQN